MCGRYVIINKLKVFEKRFNATAVTSNTVLPNFNIAAGFKAPIITNDHGNLIQFYTFGLTPFWAKKPMYLINARAEGDQNKEDNPNYSGAKGIIAKPSFRKPIRSQRCLVLADFFIEGPAKEKLDKPFLVYLKDCQPFAMAGIWDEWANPETGEIVKSFSIITTTANSLLQKIPHHRSPVILAERDERTWLQSNDLAEVTALLKPYDASLMNAYPIDKAIKSPKNNSIDLLQPIGDSLVQDLEMIVQKELVLHGMGEGKRSVPRSLFD
jgi:putative SOS response-associated peptidase YedK